MNRWIPAALIGAPMALACSAGEDATPALHVTTDTIGDTIVVRTVAGQAWDADRVLEPELQIGTLEGEDVYMLGDVNGLAVAPDGSMYVYDRQVPALRKYSAEGEYVATFAREGGGPGEYRQSDGGLAVLSDGRVLLRDPGNARINVYSPDGETLEHWPLRGGYFTSNPLVVDTADVVYTQIWGRSDAGNRYSALQRIAADGEPLDSLPLPEWDYDAPTVSLTSDGMSMVWGVPFAPGEEWGFSPHGYFIGGVADRYSLDVFRPDGSVLRIQREVEPVPVEPEEAQDARARVVANFRRQDPAWRWNGPDVPHTKPPYTEIQVAREGRIWVRVPRPSVRVPEEVVVEPSDPDAPPPQRWREPVAFDVFDPDGTYLGAVAAPHGVATYPAPVMDREHVWAITRDEFDVEYLTRFRIVAAGTEGGTDRTVGPATTCALKLQISSRPA